MKANLNFLHPIQGFEEDRMAFLEALVLCLLIRLDRDESEDLIEHATSRAGSTQSIAAIARQYRSHVFGRTIGYASALEN